MWPPQHTLPFSSVNKHHSNGKQRHWCHEKTCQANCMSSCVDSSSFLRKGKKKKKGEERIAIWSFVQVISDLLWWLGGRHSTNWRRKSSWWDCWRRNWHPSCGIWADGAWNRSHSWKDQSLYSAGNYAELSFLRDRACHNPKQHNKYVKFEVIPCIWLQYLLFRPSYHFWQALSCCLTVNWQSRRYPSYLNQGSHF